MMPTTPRCSYSGIVPPSISLPGSHDACFSIGRVTKGLLIGIGDQIDIIEPVARFTEQLQREPGVGRIFNDGLEFWQPPQGVVYDLIWLQWCVIYLDDESLVRFLETCKTVLNPDGGIIVLKDNISIDGLDIPDDEDGGVTRYVMNSLRDASCRSRS
jgi:protein N-terminal methyltransferase